MKIKNNSKGITLLELMIVAVVIGITSTFAIPEFDHVLYKLRLKSAGRDVVSALRFARSNAVSQRFQFGVYFNSNSNQYILFKDKASPGSYIYEPFADSAMVTQILPSHVDFGSGTFTNSVVIFKPDGSASTSGTIDLCSTEGDDAFTVDVLRSTGRVKLIASSQSIDQ